MRELYCSREGFKNARIFHAEKRFACDIGYSRSSEYQNVYFRRCDISRPYTETRKKGGNIGKEWWLISHGAKRGGGAALVCAISRSRGENLSMIDSYNVTRRARRAKEREARFN